MFCNIICIAAVFTLCDRLSIVGYSVSVQRILFHVIRESILTYLDSLVYCTDEMTIPTAVYPCGVCVCVD